MTKLKPVLCKCGCGEMASGKMDHGKISEYLRGHNVRGRTMPYLPRPSMIGRRSGEKHPLWKGDKVGYAGVHKWIKLQKGEPNVCEFCGTTSSSRYEWANKTRKYLRDTQDWMRLCVSCHRKYDKRGLTSIDQLRSYENPLH